MYRWINSLNTSSNNNTTLHSYHHSYREELQQVIILDGIIRNNVPFTRKQKHHHHLLQQGIILITVYPIHLHLSYLHRKCNCWHSDIGSSTPAMKNRLCMWSTMKGGSGDVVVTSVESIPNASRITSPPRSSCQVQAVLDRSRGGSGRKWICLLSDLGDDKFAIA